MRKPDVMLREYFNKVSDDDLKYIYTRLNQRLSSDMGDAVNALSRSDELDRWFSSAKNSWEFYDMIDLAQRYAEREVRNRPAFDDVV